MLLFWEKKLDGSFLEQSLSNHLSRYEQQAITFDLLRETVEPYFYVDPCIFFIPI